MPRRLRTVLHCLPLGLLALVMVREKPWAAGFSRDVPWAMAATVLINFAIFLPLKAARWRVALTQPPRFLQVLAATMEGLLANAAVGYGSGDLVRSAKLRSERTQLSLDYACSWAERGAEFLALATLALATAVAMNLGWPAVALSVLGMGIYGAVLGAGRFLVPRLRNWPRVQLALSSGLRASTPRRVALMALLSLLGWSSEIVMLVIFQRAFHLPASLGMALLTLVGINAAIVIPTSPGNFGAFEAGATMAMVMCGVPRDTAVLFALTYHLTHVIPVAVVATAVFTLRSLRRRPEPGQPQRQ